MTAIDREFGAFSIPDRIVRSSAADGESVDVARDYGSVRREDLNRRQLAMMTVDAALMTDEAIAYFLPVLAREALLGTTDAFLLSQRLEAFDRTWLTASQAEALTHLIEDLRGIDDELEQLERRDTERGREIWRSELRASNRVDDQLLLAAEAGDAEGVKEALVEGADPEYADSRGNTAERLARTNGHSNVLTILREHIRTHSR